MGMEDWCGHDHSADVEVVSLRGRVERLEVLVRGFVADCEPTNFAGKPVAPSMALLNRARAYLASTPQGVPHD